MATVREARVDIGTHLRDGWRDNPTSLAVPLYFEGQKYTPPAPTLPWALCSIRHNTGTQSGFRDGEERYEYTGILILQLFTPLVDANGRNDALALNDELAQIAREILEGARTENAGAIFINVSSREIGADTKAGWFQTNIVAEFRYENIH